MRLVASFTMCLMPILANAAQTAAQAQSDPQAYCVNRSADFYPYTGEPCKGGYQLGSGNCQKTDGRIVAVPRESSALQWPAPSRRQTSLECEQNRAVAADTVRLIPVLKAGAEVAEKVNSVIQIVMAPNPRLVLGGVPAAGVWWNSSRPTCRFDVNLRVSTQPAMHESFALSA